MTINEAIEILELHNQWRRGAEIPMQEPALVGEAIEVVISVLRHIPDVRKKITAVEWLEDKLLSSRVDLKAHTHIIDLFEQAKQMEKEQIIDAFKSSDDNSITTDNYKMLSNNDAEQYYNETYNTIS